MISPYEFYNMKPGNIIIDSLQQQWVVIKKIGCIFFIKTPAGKIQQVSCENNKIIDFETNLPIPQLNHPDTRLQAIW